MIIPNRFLIYNKFIEKNIIYIVIVSALIFFHFLFRSYFFDFSIVNIAGSENFFTTLQKIFSNNHNLNILIGFILIFLFCFNLKFREFNNQTKLFFLSFFFLFQFLVIAKHSIFIEFFSIKDISVRYIIFVIGFLSLIRPAFLLVTVFYCLLHSYIIGYITNSYNSDLDYRSLIYYLSFYLFTLSLLKYSDLFLKRQNFLKNLNFLILLTFSIHIAVYFNSGIGKIILDSNYIFNNPTFNGTGMAQITGWFTLEEYFDWVSALVIKYFVLINLLVCFFQILSPLSLINARFLIVFMIFFELQHITIALLTGVFFWKWIIFNLIFCFILVKFKSDFIFSRKKIFFLILFCLSLINFFNLPRFAWLDSKYINDLQIIAVDKNNKEYTVPSNFFLDGSVISAQHFPNLITDYNFNTYIGGALEDKDLAKKLNSNCNDMLVQFNPPKKNVEILKTYVREYFLRYIKNYSEKNYNLFPHHIWSAFIPFKEFYNLDKKNIKNIILNFRSFCLEYDKDKNFYIGKNFSTNYIIQLLN